MSLDDEPAQGLQSRGGQKIPTYPKVNFIEVSINQPIVTGEARKPLPDIVKGFCSKGRCQLVFDLTFFIGVLQVIPGALYFGGTHRKVRSDLLTTVEQDDTHFAVLVTLPSYMR